MPEEINRLATDAITDLCREANNAKLHGDAAHYVPGSDLLFSESGADVIAAAAN